MNLTLFLPWFPILLAVGVGGRLLGRSRGFALGVLCALFWVVLVQASAGRTVWHDRWTMLSVIAGVAAIIAIGGWAGEMATENTRLRDSGSLPSLNSDFSSRLAGACRRCDEWLQIHRGDADPWPAFDEFLRMTLHQVCGATHVRPYRVGRDVMSLESLRAEEARKLGQPERPASPKAMETLAPGLPARSAEPSRSAPGGDSTEPVPAWCFLVQRGELRMGVVEVGRFEHGLGISSAEGEAVQSLVALFWGALIDAIRGRKADTEDPVSGLLTRKAFLQTGEDALHASYTQNEPVALAVIALEHLRELNDSGRWETADELVGEVADVLRRKARPDDCLGRFDGSRFLILFRRVDARLASLIIAQVMTRLGTLCADAARWRANITVRCGVVGSGAEAPDLRALISGALRECHQARDERRPIGSNLAAVSAAAEAIP